MTQNSADPKAHLAPVESPRQKSQPKYLQIRDLDKFQHYKDRNPPWIKLHAHFLEDYEFQQLPDATKYHFFMLMLLASRCRNRIPNDPEWIRVKIGAFEAVDLPALLRFGFLEPVGVSARRTRTTAAIKGQMPLPDASNVLADCKQDASNMLASCKQDASAETETEGETETHTETDTEDASNLLASPDGASAGESVSIKHSYKDCLQYAEHLATQPGANIQNPGGLARDMHKKHYADALIEAFVRPPTPPPKRQFLDEPCRACFGAKREVVPGHGARPCEHCIDERGKRTGREPKPDLTEERRRE